MSTRFDVDTSEFDALMARLRRETPGLALKALRVAEAIPIGEIKIEMAKAKHGRRYGNHIASAPGEAPAIDTGELAGSVRELGAASSSLETWVEYGSDVPQGAYMEFGTSTIAPRPWLVTTTQRLWRPIVATFSNALRRSLEALG